MSLDLTNIGTIRELMRRHNTRFSKGLGQNFLINPSVCPRIAELGGVDENTAVLEIGPGIGVLTVELAKRAKKVVSVELDNRLFPILKETLAEYPNVKVVEGDILKVDLHQLFREEFDGMEVVVCANLPYYITSPVLMRLLEERLPIRSITAMVQKEAAQRITAPLPSREMGAITVSVAYYAETEILFPVSSGSFLPAPKVDSCVIRLDLHREPPVQVKEETLFRVIRAAFSQRRKTLLNCLSSGLGMDKTPTREALERAGVDPGLRAEQLRLEDFAAIANALNT
ncbi:MAG: 16S rRNA (adenine(1518)-N(6)/adenine(1519)-N(6))-dimethyltransferase RsmA [Oscillospiraceae bacterium]